MESTSQDHKGLIEAALFMASEPMSVNDLSKLSGVHSLGYLRNVLDELKREYDGKGFHLVETPDGWQFQVRNEFLSRVARLTPYADLPEGCKRCLAIVAYKEPVLQSEVIRIQGNKAYAYIKRLVNKGLIKVEPQGRSKLMRLTSEFERYFGGSKEEIRRKLVEKLNMKEREI